MSLVQRWVLSGEAHRHPMEAQTDAGHPGVWGETARRGNGSLHGVPAPAQNTRDTLHTGKSTGRSTQPQDTNTKYIKLYIKL